MEWIVFAKSDSAAFVLFGMDYARRQKRWWQPITTYAAGKWVVSPQFLGEADGPMHVAQKCAAILGLRHASNKGLMRVA